MIKRPILLFILIFHSASVLSLNTVPIRNVEEDEFKIDPDVKSNGTEELPLITDKVGINKIIVVLTESGRVIGIDNINGGIVWSFYDISLEHDLKNENSNIPTFVQRTTTHYPYAAQCAIVTKSGLVLLFNPINGEIIERTKLDVTIKQSLLLNHQDSTFLRGVLVVDENDIVHIFPQSTHEVFLKNKDQYYLMIGNEQTGLIEGYNFAGYSKKEPKCFKVWSLQLPHLEVDNHSKMLVVFKRFNEHIHSQTKVLGQTSVSYKYLNPNLIAIVIEAADSNSTPIDYGKKVHYINVYLVDAVTGSIIYSSIHQRSRGPIYVFHAENNMIYSFYNDKSRRTDLSTLVDKTQMQILPSGSRTALPLIEGPSELNENNPISKYDVQILWPEYSKSDIVAQLSIGQVPNKNLLDVVIPEDDLSKNNSSLKNNENDVTHDLSLTITLAFSMLFGFGLVIWYKLNYLRKNVPSVPNSNIVHIGKISFSPQDIVGRGSSGTCVYKGLFEGKQKIAVKRVIADYYILADREIELLRTLQHPHLIRYFATEGDNLFRYIATELAEITLSDYVELKILGNVLNQTQILLESTKGLAHLHSLNIVHRDIKPQNILISFPLRPSGKRKILISDFGVSKILSHDKSINSETITKVIKGTEGWIAPEVFNSKVNKKDFKPSKHIDIFSLGCLFYYVLTDGEHPYGDSLQRQSNILKNEFALTHLNGEETLLQSNLIESMIAGDPSNRPSVESIMKHPLFWNPNKQLQFFQDVSDRIENETPDSDIVLGLEKGAFDVVRGDWRRQISVELQLDLRKFRNYKGSSVRDLLRALRNKKHHYRELSPELQLSLGSVPDQFVFYFTSRFPRLLIHSYIAMEAYKCEDMFKDYYDQNSSWDFSFKQLHRSNIRWFEFNNSPEKSVPDLQNERVSLSPNGISFLTEKQPNQLLNWKSCRRKKVNKPSSATKNQGAPLVTQNNNTEENNMMPEFSKKWVYEESDETVKLDLS